MKGQWLGTNTGTNPGGLIVNFDEFHDHLAGLAIFTPAMAGVPVTVATLRTVDKADNGKFTAPLTHLDRNTFGVLDAPTLTSRFPGIVFPVSADVEYDLKNNVLEIGWKSTVGTLGKASLPRSDAGEPSILVAPLKSWTDFKTIVEALPYRQFIFRGQENSRWRLRTSYHRLGRANVERFRLEDMHLLNRFVNGRTSHLYDMAIPDHFGALLHLAQHHGYPTPLLDWSYSPYVAAFCAFRRVDPATTRGNVRIFIFDKDGWVAGVLQDSRLATPSLNFSVLEFLAMDNDRMVAQQALSTVTNLDDIESYIRYVEALRGKTYLTAVDIPASNRHAVIRDLSRMGINAASMFPGLDGVCEELKERMFA